MEDVLSKRRQRAQSHLPWLYQELRMLQQDGVVDQITAQKLKQLYGYVPPGSGRLRWMIMTALAILGAILASGGIIMLAGYNWDGLPHKIKLFLSLLPLLGGLVFGIWVLVQEKSSVWTESAAVFISVALAVAIGLVAQAYHLNSNLPLFLLIWSVLTLPLLYLFRSTVTAILYLVLICSWGGFAGGKHLAIWPFWLLLGAYVPYWLQEKKRTGNSAGIVWQKWGMAAGCFFVPGVICAQAFAPFDWRTGYLLAFTALYLCSVIGHEQGEPFRRRPFANLGLIGMGVVAFCLCFRQNWSIGTANLVDALTVSHYINTAILGLLVVGWLFLNYYLVFYRKYFSLLWSAIVLLPPALWLAQKYGLSNNVAAWIFGGYCFSAGLIAMVIGFRIRNMPRMNGGLIMVMLPVLVKFFDNDFTIIHKGVVMVSFGVIMLATNLTLSCKLSRLQCTESETGEAA